MFPETTPLKPLPVERLMSPSLFWEVFQRVNKPIHGFASLWPFSTFQDHVKRNRVSFQGSLGLRFLMRVSKNKVELFPATVRNCGFQTYPDGVPIDVSSSLPFSFLEFCSDAALFGSFECEIRGIKKFSSLKLLGKPEVSLVVTDLLEIDGEEVTHWPWYYRLEHLKKLNAAFPFFPILSGDDFLPFEASLKEQRAFCKRMFEEDRTVDVREKTGIYETLSHRGAQFRCMTLRSEFESTCLLWPQFLPLLESKEISTPSFLEEVVLLRAKQTKKFSLDLITCLEVRSVKTGEIFDVLTLPMTVRKKLSAKIGIKKQPVLLNHYVGKTAWIESLNTNSRWSLRLVAVEKGED